MARFAYPRRWSPTGLEHLPVTPSRTLHPEHCIPNNLPGYDPWNLPAFPALDNDPPCPLDNPALRAPAKNSEMRHNKV